MSPPGRAATPDGRAHHWLARQVEEIAVDPVLRLYGLALASGYVVTFLAWTTPPGSAGMLSSGAPAICWPFWENCAVARVLIVVQDFRLRLNQHTMLAWVATAFLLLPSKRRLIPALLVSFYFLAGILKLDGEWLSGAALYNLDRFCEADPTFDMWRPNPWILR